MTTLQATVCAKQEDQHPGVILEAELASVTI